MYILLAIVRSWGELVTEESEEENDDTCCNRYFGRIWLGQNLRLTIDEIEDRVYDAIRQDGEGLTRFIHWATKGTKYLMSGVFFYSQL